jgi:hypothetical protein
MKNVRKLSIVPLLLCLIFIVGCSDDSDLITKPENQIPVDLKVRDGVVHFENQLAFNKTMELLHKNGPSQLENFERSIGFTNSLRSKLLSIENEELPPVNIKDLFFASVVNSEGVFFIGNTIHKITEEFEFAMPNGDEKLLTEALANRTSEKFKDAGIVEHRIISRDFSNAHFSGESQQSQSLGTDQSGNSKRIVMQAWSRNYLAYASNGVNLNTESYRRTCGLCSKKWRDSAVEYIKVSVESRQYSSITGTGYWFVLNKEEEAYSYDHVQKIMDYVVGTGVWIDTEYIKCTYSWIGGSSVNPIDYTLYNTFIEWRN